MTTHNVNIGNNVWLAVRSIVLDGCILNDGAVLGACSVAKPRSVLKHNTVYTGNSAETIRERSITTNYK
jgi:acetyltransferase-like isoleucine patch superfamily enzyme